MKVTVNFGSVRIIVPCGEGELLVRDLMKLAITRYNKATGKSPDSWVVIHNLKLSTDGGILDPDDRVHDVADDREQIIAIYKEQSSPYGSSQRHGAHGEGDGTSSSSLGTESPDLFQVEVLHYNNNNNNNLPPSATLNKNTFDCAHVEINSNHVPSGLHPLQVRRGSEPALNRLSPVPVVSTHPDPSKRWSAAVIHVEPVDILPSKSHLSSHRRQSSSSLGQPSEEEEEDQRGEGSGEEKSTSSRLSRGSGRLSILGSSAEMLKWSEAADRHLGQMHDCRKEPLGGSAGTSPDVESDASNTNEEDRPMREQEEEKATTVILANEAGPLGIHVVPDYKGPKGGPSAGGLVVQGVEPGGRIDRDGRLRVGDRIVEINGRSLRQVSFQHAQDIFKEALGTPQIQLRLVKSQGTLPSVLPSVLANGGPLPPSRKPPPPPVYPKPVVSSTGQPGGQVLSGQLQRPEPKLVEGEERAGVVAKVATVTPTKKVPPTAAANLVARPAPLASNTRKIGRKIPIQLTKGPEGLGFSITTRDNPAGGNCPIYIKNILPKGAAIQDGRLKPGDRLLEVNGMEMTGKTQTEAVSLLRHTPPGGSVELVVSRQELDTSAPSLPRELPPDQSDVIDAASKQREILTFDIPLNDTGSAGLGVSVKGKSSTGPNGPVDLGIFVKSVIHGGAASKDGRLCMNDQLVNINGISLLSMTNSQAMETLRRAMTQGEGPNALPDAITLTVARRLVPSSASSGGQLSDSSFEHRNDSLLSSSSSSCGERRTPKQTPDNSTSEASETTVIFRPNTDDSALGGRNPVIDRLMGGGGLRNESYLRASHESWGGDQLQQALYGQVALAKARLLEENTVVIEEDTLLMPGSGPGKDLTVVKRSSTEGAQGNQAASETATAPTEGATGGEEGEPTFSRDGFGRQSISEKRHAQLDARNTDTYQRNKKKKEREEKDRNDNPESTAQQERPVDVEGCRPPPERLHLPDGAPNGDVAISTQNVLLRSSSAESLLNRKGGQPFQKQAQLTVLSGGDGSGLSDSAGNATTTNSTATTTTSSGLRKSTSLESLQTLVREMRKEDDEDNQVKHQRHHTTYPYHHHHPFSSSMNGAARAMAAAAAAAAAASSKGRGCNESFRAAVDRSYEVPPVTETMETLEEESETGVVITQSQQQHNQAVFRDLAGPGLTCDDLLLPSPTSPSSKAKKKGLLKGLGNVFKFGKHRKITQETIQKLSREQLEQEAEMLRARRAAQEEQERIQEQYRKLVERQQQQQQQQQQLSKEALQHHMIQQQQHQFFMQQQQGGSVGSRQERMQLLRAQHQRLHMERQGLYPKEAQEELYEKELKERIQQRQLRPLPHPPSDFNRGYPNGHYPSVLSMPKRNPDKTAAKEVTPPVGQHKRTNSFDIFREMERPGSRRGIADSSKFSHYMNYKEIQQHLRQQQHPQQQQQQQQQPQQQQPKQQQQQQPQKANDRHPPQTHPSQQMCPVSRHGRPISNYFEYESIQSLYSATAIPSNAHPPNSSEVSASSLPRRALHSHHATSKVSLNHPPQVPSHAAPAQNLKLTHNGYHGVQKQRTSKSSLFSQHKGHRGDVPGSKV